MSQSLLSRVAEVVRRPDTVTDMLQILKCVVAATAAWWFAISVLESQLPFLAPWTALLTVHATVYRSLSRGVQTTVASSIGVMVSFLIGSYLGVSLWTFALALLVGLLGSRLTWIRDEGVSIATTAIFVLGSGFGEQAPLLMDRLLEVGVGVGFGVAVNLLIIPPLRDQQAARYVDSINRRIGGVLTDMADEFATSWDTDQAETWYRETTSMDEELASAWQTVRFARESERVNPRRRLRPLGSPGRLRSGDSGSGSEVSYEEILQRVDESISHLRHLARTLHVASYAEGQWDTRFREKWSRVARDAGRVIADPDAEVEPVQDRLESLSRTMAETDGLPAADWPVYGSLITSMRHIAAVVDDVASARDARSGDRENPET